MEIGPSPESDCFGTAIPKLQLVFGQNARILVGECDITSQVKVFFVPTSSIGAMSLCKACAGDSSPLSPSSHLLTTHSEDRVAHLRLLWCHELLLQSWSSGSLGCQPGKSQSGPTETAITARQLRPARRVDPYKDRLKRSLPRSLLAAAHR